MDSFNNYVESSITYTIDTEQSTKLSTMPSEKPVRHKPWTPEWLDQMIRKLDNPQAVGYLRAWMPNRRELEATEATIMALRELDHNDAIIAIKSLKRHKKFVRGTKGQDLKLNVIVENIENDNRIKANALLDSGATGSCIN